MSRTLAMAGVVAVGLSATIAWELRDDAAVIAADLPRPPAVSLRRDPPAAMDGAAQAWIDTTLDRPLFREDRRPAKLAAEPMAKLEQRARLTGIIASPGGNRAIFVVASTPKPVVAKEGDRVGGLLVRAIRPGQAIVAAGNDVLTLIPSFADTRPPSRP